MKNQKPEEIIDEGILEIALVFQNNYKMTKEQSIECAKGLEAVLYRDALIKEYAKRKDWLKFDANISLMFEIQNEKKQ